MAGKVINLRNAPFGWRNNPNFVYIGRAGHGFDGYYGNPIRLTRDTPQMREEVLHQYYDWAAERIHNDQEFAKRVLDLHGKTLVCFCKPKACHGDVLLILIDYMLKEANK